MNRPTYMWLALTLGSLIYGLAGSRPAAAQAPAGVVLDFSGPAGGQARGAVVDGADGVLALTSREEAERAAGAAGVQLDDHAGVVRVASDLGLAVLIRGRVTGRGRRAVVQIRVVDAAGNDVAFREVSGDPRRRSGRRQITDATREVLAQAMTDLAARAAREEQERQRAQAAQIAELRAPDPEEDEPSAAHQPRFAARIGWGGRNRHAAVELDPGTDKLYEAGLFSELRIAVEGRPFATDDSAMAGLYASLDMHFSLGLSSQDATDGRSIGSQVFGMMLSAGYLARAWQGERLLAGAVVGFGYESFSIDDNPTLPSSAYPHLRFGAVARAQILEELLTARLDLGLRWAFGVGDFGDAFGQDSGALGFDFGIAVGGGLDLGLDWAVRFAYTRFGLNFSGDVATMPVGGVTPVQAAGGFDKGIELGVEVGWRLP